MELSRMELERPCKSGVGVLRTASRRTTILLSDRWGPHQSGTVGVSDTCGLSRSGAFVPQLVAFLKEDLPSKRAPTSHNSAYIPYRNDAGKLYCWRPLTKMNLLTCRTFGAAL